MCAPTKAEGPQHAHPIYMVHWWTTYIIHLPVVDVNRPWGGPGCEECGGFCCGHYQKPGAMA